jgi:hypothetical protein
MAEENRTRFHTDGDIVANVSSSSDINLLSATEVSNVNQLQFCYRPTVVTTLFCMLVSAPSIMASDINDSYFLLLSFNGSLLINILQDAANLSSDICLVCKI